MIDQADTPQGDTSTSEFTLPEEIEKISGAVTLQALLPLSSANLIPDCGTKLFPYHSCKSGKEAVFAEETVTEKSVALPGVAAVDYDKPFFTFVTGTFSIRNKNDELSDKEITDAVKIAFHRSLIDLVPVLSAPFPSPSFENAALEVADVAVTISPSEYARPERPDNLFYDTRMLGEVRELGITVALPSVHQSANATLVSHVLACFDSKNNDCYNTMKLKVDFELASDAGVNSTMFERGDKHFLPAVPSGVVLSVDEVTKLTQLAKLSSSFTEMDETTWDPAWGNDGMKQQFYSADLTGPALSSFQAISAESSFNVIPDLKQGGGRIPTHSEFDLSVTLTNANADLKIHHLDFKENLKKAVSNALNSLLGLDLEVGHVAVKLFPQFTRQPVPEVGLTANTAKTIRVRIGLPKAASFDGDSSVKNQVLAMYLSDNSALSSYPTGHDDISSTDVAADFSLDLTLQKIKADEKKNAFQNLVNSELTNLLQTRFGNTDITAGSATVLNTEVKEFKNFEFPLGFSGGSVSGKTIEAGKEPCPDMNAALKLDGDDMVAAGWTIRPANEMLKSSGQEPALSSNLRAGNNPANDMMYEPKHDQYNSDGTEKGKGVFYVNGLWKENTFSQNGISLAWPIGNYDVCRKRVMAGTEWPSYKMSGYRKSDGTKIPADAATSPPTEYHGSKKGSASSFAEMKTGEGGVFERTLLGTGEIEVKFGNCAPYNNLNFPPKDHPSCNCVRIDNEGSPKTASTRDNQWCTRQADGNHLVSDTDKRCKVGCMCSCGYTGNAAKPQLNCQGSEVRLQLDNVLLKTAWPGDYHTVRVNFKSGQVLKLEGLSGYMEDGANHLVLPYMMTLYEINYLTCSPFSPEDMVSGMVLGAMTRKAVDHELKQKITALTKTDADGNNPVTVASSFSPENLLAITRDANTVYDSPSSFARFRAILPLPKIGVHGLPGPSADAGDLDVKETLKQTLLKDKNDKTSSSNNPFKDLATTLVNKFGVPVLNMTEGVGMFENAKHEKTAVSVSEQNNVGNFTDIDILHESEDVATDIGRDPVGAKEIDIRFLEISGELHTKDSSTFSDSALQILLQQGVAAQQPGTEKTKRVFPVPLEDLGAAFDAITPVFQTSSNSFTFKRAFKLTVQYRKKTGVEIGNAISVFRSDQFKSNLQQFMTDNSGGANSTYGIILFQVADARLASMSTVVIRFVNKPNKAMTDKPGLKNEPWLKLPLRKCFREALQTVATISMSDANVFFDMPDFDYWPSRIPNVFSDYRYNYFRFALSFAEQPTTLKKVLSLSGAVNTDGSSIVENEFFLNSFLTKVNEAGSDPLTFMPAAEVNWASSYLPISGFNNNDGEGKRKAMHIVQSDTMSFVRAYLGADDLLVTGVGASGTVVNKIQGAKLAPLVQKAVFSAVEASVPEFKIAYKPWLTASDVVVSYSNPDWLTNTDDFYVSVPVSSWNYKADQKYKSATHDIAIETSIRDKVTALFKSGGSATAVSTPFFDKLKTRLSYLRDTIYHKQAPFAQEDGSVSLSAGTEPSFLSRLTFLRAKLSLTASGSFTNTAAIESAVRFVLNSETKSPKLFAESIQVAENELTVLPTTTDNEFTVICQVLDTKSLATRAGLLAQHLSASTDLGTTVATELTAKLAADGHTAITASSFGSTRVEPLSQISMQGEFEHDGDAFADGADTLELIKIIQKAFVSALKDATQQTLTSGMVSIQLKDGTKDRKNPMFTVSVPAIGAAFD
ncbi:unnamed protein product, partial [Amoebophrya sp. A120]